MSNNTTFGYSFNSNIGTDSNNQVNDIPMVNAPTSKTMLEKAKHDYIQNLLYKYEGLMNQGYNRHWMYAEVPVKFGSIDELDQRELNKSRVNKIASEFNFDKVDIKYCMIVNGELKYFEGEHTLAAMQKLIEQGKLDPETTLPSKVFVNIASEYASYLFGSQDDNKTRVSKPDKFKAFARAGYSYYRDMMNIIESRGLTCKSGRKKGWDLHNITSPVMVENIYKNDGREALIFILDLIRKAGWHDQLFAYKAHFIILGGIAWKYRQDSLALANLLTIMQQHYPRSFEGMSVDWCNGHGVTYPKHSENAVRDYVTYLFTGEIPVPKKEQL